MVWGGGRLVSKGVTCFARQFSNTCLALSTGDSVLVAICCDDINGGLKEGGMGVELTNLDLKIGSFRGFGANGGGGRLDRKERRGCDGYGGGGCE